MTARKNTPKKYYTAYYDRNRKETVVAQWIGAKVGDEYFLQRSEPGQRGSSTIPRRQWHSVQVFKEDAVYSSRVKAANSFATKKGFIFCNGRIQRVLLCRSALGAIVTLDRKGYHAFKTGYTSRRQAVAAGKRSTMKDIVYHKRELAKAERVFSRLIAPSSGNDPWLKR